MSSNVDVVRALQLLEQLEPELLAHEAAVPPVPPVTRSLGDGDALDGALRSGLARLRVEIGRETFLYLRWRAERACEAAAAGRLASASRRAARAAGGAAGGRVSTVSETAPDDRGDPDERPEASRAH